MPEPGRAGQRAGCAFLLGQAGEPLRGQLDVRQQALRGERIGMGLVELLLIGLGGVGQMQFERGRAGERRGIQPARHGDDHRRADRHGDIEPQPRAGAFDMRQEPHQIGPERVDRDRDRGRIDDRAEEHQHRRAVQQPAHAEIGIDAAGERQHGERDLGRGLKACLAKPELFRHSCLSNEMRALMRLVNPAMTHHIGLRAAQEAWMRRGAQSVVKSESCRRNRSSPVFAALRQPHAEFGMISGEAQDYASRAARSIDRVFVATTWRTA